MKTVIIASKNPVKIQVAERAFAAVFPDEEFEFIGVASQSKVPDQPFNEETFLGAQNRLAFIKNEFPNADYWISQEGGVFNEGDTLYNRAWIMVQDKDGFIGKSSTASFYPPKQVAEYIKQGDELGTAAINFLTQQIQSKQQVQLGS